MNFDKFDFIFSKLSGVVCFFDFNDEILYSNKLFADLLGYSQKEMQKKDILSLLGSDHKFDFINAINHRNNTRKITVKFFHKLGYHLYFSIEIYTFEDSYQIIGTHLKRNFKGFNFDIVEDNTDESSTPHKFDADDLTVLVGENFDNLKFLLDKLPIDLWIKDKDHRYLYMNKALIKRTQLEGVDYYLKDDFILFDRDVANDFLKSDLLAASSNKKIGFTFESKSDRFVKWTEVSKIPVYNENNTFLGLIGSAVDVTHSKVKEHEIEIKNESLSKLLVLIFDFVICVNNSGYIETALGKLFDNIPSENHLSNLFYSENVGFSKPLVDLFNEALQGTLIKKTISIYDQYTNLEIKPVFELGKVVKVIGYGTIVKGDFDD